jgi:hypothetical protein
MYYLNIFLTIVLVMLFGSFVFWSVKDYRAEEYDNMKKNLLYALIAISILYVNHFPHF